MASILKVDKLDPQSGTALEVGTSGDTVTVPSGVGLTLTDSTLLLPTTVTATTEVKTNKISPATGVAFALGESGDTFTVPSGATITNNGTATGFGGGSMTYLATVTASDDASVTLNGYFTSDYDVYRVYVVNARPATTYKVLGMRVRVSDADVTSGSYYGATTGNSRSSGANRADANGGWAETSAKFSWAEGSPNDATFTINGYVEIFNPLGTTSYKYYNWQFGRSADGSTPTYFMTHSGSGYAATASALTGISFSMAGFTSNIDVGDFQLYGFKNS